jgi:hypothetical protein
MKETTVTNRHDDPFRRQAEDEVRRPAKLSGARAAGA